MEKNMKGYYFKILFLLIAFVSVISLLRAQDAVKQLVVSEVYLDSTNQEVWLEIFNPTDIKLSLKSMRISSIRMLSVLPREYEGQKSIDLKPGERMVVCSDIQSFRTKYGISIRAAELKLMKQLLKGGFVSINNLTDKESKNNIIRVGLPEKSKTVSPVVGDDQVLNITAEGKSYLRGILNDGEISAWYKSIPKPGQVKEGREEK
jgi:hypothetical protein